MASAFFYGTLMHPEILKRVLHNDASHLQTCPAIPMVRLHATVKYVGLQQLNRPASHNGAAGKQLPASGIPSSRIYEHVLLGRELTPGENSIRGTLLMGFTAMDIMFLDVFEGDQYARLEVYVHPLGRLTPVPSDAAVTSSEATVEGCLIPAALPSLPSASKLAPPIPAQTYVWCLEVSGLEKELWLFDEFVRKNAYKWIGPGAWDNEDYSEVDV